MTISQRNSVLDKIIELLETLYETEPDEQSAEPTARQQIRMLTIKECAALAPGVSEHTIRKLVYQRKVKYIRTGEGNCGKILINAASFQKYLESQGAK